MHLFMLLTRHSKEQSIKENRKTLHKRRRAYKLRDWDEYKKIVKHEIDMEQLKSKDVFHYTMK